MHSDTKIAQAGAGQFVFGAAAPQLKVKLLEPKDATAKVESNVVMGPGRPGSVDKGTLEPRGERAVVSTKAPATAAAFEWEMTF